MHHRVEIRRRVGNLRQVHIEHATEVQVDFIVQFDAVLHERIIAFRDDGSVLIRLWLQDVRRGDENRELRTNLM